ncbi:hypothetical protein BC830DRAFT_321183 [Chytriomyces sp. MP71]|nr:hypothetical protein BC830DRAFT_321183 [Chytriomyces sp. MP71]
MSKQPQSSQGAKGTPSSAPTASAVLNDETWSTYIYAIAPDERTGISLQAAYDMIGSGYRSRFTVFSKADLMGWVSNARKHYYFQDESNIARGNLLLVAPFKADYCKDFKAALDANGGNDNEVPEAIMARLIKQRLLILKQEGNANNSSHPAYCRGRQSRCEISSQRR